MAELPSRSKKAEKAVGKQEAKKGTTKAPSKKIAGTAQIGIEVSKEDDFAAWYQQVLTKGDLLDYYDVSGCYILKVGRSILGQKGVWSVNEP